ncbi:MULTISPECIES: AbrB/MazE/SpoVT family DNA-binding domain-containing protein [Pantoea]|uniref:AbrB/MazE/SpoVT family DNA-binding domain-containing protein n=1 Tax=Pantoea TaxID=53335 RepID=UPI0021C81278|nr:MULTISPECIES: AbrB/MazE/SpoVT family DNA-binding domain-containing protein [Pantoea]
MDGYRNREKWGNSPAIRLTADVMRAANLNVDDRVEITVVEGQLTVRPVKKRPTLAELVARITPENMHDAVEWRAPVGKEINEG